MRALLLATGAPILFLFLLRVLPRAPVGLSQAAVAAVTPESSRRHVVRARAAAARARRSCPGRSQPGAVGPRPDRGR